MEYDDTTPTYLPLYMQYSWFRPRHLPFMLGCVAECGIDISEAPSSMRVLAEIQTETTRVRLPHYLQWCLIVCAEQKALLQRNVWSSPVCYG